MFIRYTAALMLAIEIVIHVDLAPDHLEEVPYIGVGFVVASVLCALAVVLVLAEHRAGWLLGSALCAGMAGAFVVSRLFGLPDYHEAWTSDNSLGLWALPPEVVFVVLTWLRRSGGFARSARVGAGRPALATTQHGGPRP
jgi:hypothetical protein